MRRVTTGAGLRRSLAGALCLLLSAGTAFALDVELKDVAADRVERQRAYSRGATPLANTPDLVNLEARLAAKGLAKGSPIFIRVFKETSELEVWMQHASDGKFVLLDTYPVCHWTGTIGPKLREGDRQSPEGFYTVKANQTRLVGRWQKAFNLGFPNAHDQLNRRTGSHILVHGGCSSVGCYAMTEQVQDEIYALAQSAIKGGQGRFHVHAFPFRMTDDNMAQHASHLWFDFWRDLKAGYDAFERTRLPPRIGICEQRYQAADGDADDKGDPASMTLLRPPSGQAPGGYAAPRCGMDAAQPRAARQVVAAAIGEDDAETPAASRRKRRPATPAATPADDEAPQSKPQRKARPASPGNGTAPIKDESDGGLGPRLHPGSPRVISSGS